MIEVEPILREFCAGLDASQIAIDPADVRHGREVVAPLVVRRAPPRRWLRPALVAGAAFAAVLLFGVAVWLVGLGGGDDPIAEDSAVATPGPVLDGAPGLLDAIWTLETSIDGWLRPVPFANGFAAIRFTDPMSEVFAETEGDSWPSALFTGEVSVGDVWLSEDGLVWAPASGQPPEQTWSIASDGETLFAEAGNVFDGTGSIWSSTDGTEWSPALAPGEYGRLFESQAPAGSWQFINGTVIAGPPGAVVFGVDTRGSVAGWVYDGGRFVPADLGTIEGLRASDGWFAVAPLHDRFVLATVDGTTYESPQHMKVSYSETGAVWSDLEPKPRNGPLSTPSAIFTGTASDEGATMVAMEEGLGLWATTDGIRWSEIALRPSANGWVPEVAHGGLGWLVFSPQRSDDGHTAAPDAMNLGLWLSADGATWSDLDDIGPLGAGLPHAFLVRDDHALVVLGADRGPGRGWGVPGDPVTEIWRLEVAPATDRSMITVTLDDIEGVEGLVIVARLLDGDDPIGETHYFGNVRWFTHTFVSGVGRIGVSPYSATSAIHPSSGDGQAPISEEVLGVEPGSYRLVVEALDPWSIGRYGCEIPIVVTGNGSLDITLADLPDFATEGIWVPDGQGRFPECPG